MKKSRLWGAFNGLCVFLLGSGDVLALAVPLSDYLIDFNQISSRVVQAPGGGSDVETLTYQQSVVAPSASNVLSPEVAGFADLTTAEVGTVTRSLVAGNELDALDSKVALFDTLSFTGSATVSFNFNVTGSLSSTDTQTNNLLSAIAGITILDITDQTQWIYGLEGTALPACFTPGCNLFERTVETDMDRYSILGENRVLISRVDHNFPSDGNDYNVNIDVAGTLDVEAGSTYGLVLTMQTLTSGASINSVDFASTGTFSITDLDGVSYASGSGALLTTVPLPAAVWLFSSGLLSLIGISRRKKAS